MNNFSYNYFNKPLNINDVRENYYLEKVHAQKESWVLKKSKIPPFISKFLMHNINKYYHEKYIYSDDLINLFKTAANPRQYKPIKNPLIKKDPDLINLVTDSNFKELAQSVSGIELPKTKFTRGVEKAAVIGHGLANLKESEQKGKILSEGYWLEAIMTQNFYGGDLKGLFDEWYSSDSSLGFEIWLKNQYPEKLASLDEVLYLKTPEERANYKIEFENGLVFLNDISFKTKNETTAFSGAGTAIFVIDTEKNLFAGSHVTGKFHHSSFLAGGAVIGAGEIKTNDDGKIIALSNKSGHYQPSVEQVFDTLKIFVEQGVDLTHVVLTLSTSQGPLIYLSAKEFLETNGQCLPNGYESFLFERDENEKITALVLNPQFSSFSAEVKAKDLENAMGYINSTFHEHSKPIIYKEKIVNDGYLEFNPQEYIQKKGRGVLPQGWSEGRIEKDEEGKLKKVIQDPDKEVLDRGYGILSYFEMRGTDLAGVEFEFMGFSQNAKEFFNQLSNKLKNENMF